MRTPFSLFLAFAVSAVCADTMFKATNVKVHVGYGYYRAQISYKYSASGKSYLRYDFTSPTEMIELIDYSEGTRSKVCSSCETGFYPYGLPMLFKQGGDTPTGEEEGDCKEYTPAPGSAALSIWYKESGDLCKVVLEDGRTLDFNESTVDATFKDETVFNLEGRECPGPVCKRVMDLVFVIDSSGSVDAESWDTIKGFLKTMVNSFEIAKDATQVGIVKYGKTASLVLDLSPELATITKAITDAQYLGGTTCTGCGINMAFDLLNNTKNHRSDLDPEKIIMVLTDGENNEIDEQTFCREYEPVCTKYGDKCAKYKCNGNIVMKNTSICARYEDDTSTCLKYKCAACTKTGSCVKYKDKCEKYSVTQCKNYSSTFCEGNPSSYCCTYDRFTGIVKNRPICGKCECTEFKCEEYACEKYKCEAYDCDVCRRPSKSCLIYKKKCAEYMQIESCDGDEVCVENECIGGTIKCKEKGLGANSHLSGAVSKARTQWSLYPTSTRTPVIFAIGVKGANMYELKGIASTVNGKQFVYKVNEFSDLFGIINELVDETCTKQTTTLEGCDASCHGFCGCNKKCYCPTCEEPTGSCYSFSCTTDNKTSAGCVPKHQECPNKNKCINVFPDNSTAGCCKNVTINCVKSDDKCLLYGCDTITGCTVEPVVCPPPKSPCFNLTGCNNRTGCEYISACPDIGPCNISVCTVDGADGFTCKYTDKCKSNDPCKIPVCDVETGECREEDMVCIPKNPCNYARCYRGECIESVNVTRKIECALMANNSCEQGYCNESSGECVVEELDDTTNCYACEMNNTLNCAAQTDGCTHYKCAAVDSHSLLTQCVLDPVYDNCLPGEDPCIIRKCSALGICETEYVECLPPNDTCHINVCAPDPADPTKPLCQLQDHYDEPNDNCSENYCKENGTPGRRDICPPKACHEYNFCSLNDDGSANCHYTPVECESTFCTIGVCNPETNQCEKLDNSARCQGDDPCMIYTCNDITKECEAEPVSCDDNDACTIDSCVPINTSDSSGSGSESYEYTSSDLSNGYVCRHEPKCTTPLFCETISCNIMGDCTRLPYNCEDMNKTALDSCHMYQCDEERRRCKIALLPSAFLSVCGECLKTYPENSTVDLNKLKNKCIAGMAMPNFAAAIGGAAIAAIVIAAIIVAAIIAATTAIGTKELIKRAKKNADVGTNNNPLYEGNDNEFTNPTFTGEDD